MGGFNTIHHVFSSVARFFDHDSMKNQAFDLALIPLANPKSIACVSLCVSALTFSWTATHLKGLMDQSIVNWLRPGSRAAFLR